VAFDRTYKAAVAKALESKKSIGKSEKYCPIDDADFARLQDFFDRSNSARLQQEVLFKICYGFGFRGREWLRGLTKDDVRVEIQGGIKFVDLLKSTAEKAVTARDPSVQKSIILAATPDSPHTCPVQAIEMYFAKFPPGVTCLWPKPLTRPTPDGYWYHDTLVVGKNSLNEFMKNLCQMTGLGCRSHTNHCIRASVVTNLLEAGASAAEVQVVTGHKRQESVEIYNKRVKFAKKVQLSHEMSSRLSTRNSLQPSLEGSSQSVSANSAAQLGHSHDNCQLVRPNAEVGIKSLAIASQQTFVNCQFDSCTFYIKP
jgi:hypothetical protein